MNTYRVRIEGYAYVYAEDEDSAEDLAARGAQSIQASMQEEVDTIEIVEAEATLEAEL